MKGNAEAIRDAMQSIMDLGVNFTPLVRLPGPTKIDLTVNGNPQGRQVTVKVVGGSESVDHAWKFNPKGSLGGLSNESGSTEHTAYFYPNGNYGEIKFIAEDEDGNQSNEVTVTFSGQTKVQAEKVYAEVKRTIKEGFENAVHIRRAVIAVIGAILAIISTLIGNLLGAVIGIIIAIVTILYILADALEINLKKNEVLNGLDEIMEPYLEVMPVEV